MHYLIDGYNFLFRILSLKKKSLEKSRESLIEILSAELKDLKGDISLIFDSAQQILDVPQTTILEHLQIVYAPKGLSADQYILELVEQCCNPKTIKVVTSDGDLARQCRYLRAPTLTIEEFIIFILKKKKKKVETKPSYSPPKWELERLLKIFEHRFKADS